MTPFIDIHCHAVVKFYLFGGEKNHSLFYYSNGQPDNNYTNRQVTVPAMGTARLNAVFTAHLLPEKFIETEWTKVKGLITALRRLIKRYKEALEGPQPFKQTICMIEAFEKYVSAHPGKATIAHSYKELDDALQNNIPAFVHTLEGAHHLGRDCELGDYIEKVKKLKCKGVAMFTIGHWFPNTIVTPCEGIPPRTKSKLGMKKPAKSDPMDARGLAVVTQILDSGMILDLTHTNPIARAQIFKLNKERKPGPTPLVFSHVGVRKLFKDEHHPEFGLMNPCDDEILEIRNCGGVIGVIFMVYWLTGKDEKPHSKKNYGYPDILATIMHIHDVTKSYENISIGTDFDGLNDPPDDYYDADMLGEFRHCLTLDLTSAGATQHDIDNIFGGNIMRVLAKGWTPLDPACADQIN
jgi:microsomal dipeptidase-like Zn-dependent dipeptidase